MQAMPHLNELPGSFDELTQEMIDKPVDYNEQRMLDAVNHPGIKSVRVFRKKRDIRNKAASASRRKNR